MNSNSLITTRKRLLIVMVSIISFFFILFVRLWFVQIIDGSKFSARAAEQWYRDLPLQAKRGEIYDRNGESVVTSKTVYTVYVRPGSVSDAGLVCEELESILGIDGEKLYEKVVKKNVSEITVKKNVDADIGKLLIAKGLEGVYLSAAYTRDYANADYLAQVIGYTNVDNVGQNGIEGYYNNYLKGVNGSVNTQTDNRGKQVGEDVFFIPAIDGANITLSVDINIQSFAEEAVELSAQEWNAKGANIIVMDADDGGIVAMAQYPSYSLDDIPRDDLAKLNAYSKNTMIVDVYEPGSTFKIFTTATAIEKNKVNQNSTFFCPGFRVVDGQRIKCWRSKGHGSQNLAEGVMNSCNCVFMDLALKLGTDELYDGLKKFGFGSKTGVDFFSESSGLLMNRANVKNVDLARIGFGQAVAVTPLQLTAGVCEVVNGGKQVTPHFVNKIADNYGNTMFSFRNSDGRIISESTSSLMRELLENVVSTGSGKKASVPGYRIGGKTGTAQKYENGAIASGKYVSSFVGFAPADDPKYVILMTVNEPTGGAYYGSIVAAPYVGQVFSKIFDYETIAPVYNGEVEEFVTMPQLEEMPTGDALKLIKELGLYCECDGDGDTVKSTLPVVGTKIAKGDVVLIRT